MYLQPQTGLYSHEGIEPVLGGALDCGVCMYVAIPFYLDVRLLVDVLAGVTQEEGHTGYLYLVSAVLALILFARKIQRFRSLVDRVKSNFGFCVPTN